MDTPRHFDLPRLWRWTLELFSLALVVFFWGLLFSGSIWGTKFRYHYLFDASLPVIVLLFITAVVSWRKHRRHAILGLVVCMAWMVWAALPRV